MKKREKRKYFYLRIKELRYFRVWWLIRQRFGRIEHGLFDIVRKVRELHDSYDIYNLFL
jgi:hypothetical protein